MPNKLTLIINGREERDVPPGRFTIGRSEENDLPVGVAGISRRHAIISHFDGEARISDCGSQNGTFINGRQVDGAVGLNDGDVISLGSVYDLVVRVVSDETAAPIPAPSVEAAPGNKRPVRNASVNRWLPMLAIGSICAIILTAIVILAIRSGNYGGPGPEETPSPALTPTPTETPGILDEPIERAVQRVVARVSRDTRPYAIPDNSYLDRIKLAVEQNSRAPGVADALTQLKQANSSLRAWSENQLKPDLLAYAALAEANGDPNRVVRAAQHIARPLIAVRTLYEDTHADSTLLYLAAFKVGAPRTGGHPLDDRIRAARIDPSTERNVWMLHERKQLSEAELGFVVNFLAYGIIAHEPRRYGVNAQSLSY
jgi:pSer/pThr/pTyr-binding forkhead associated (FHA) protein